MILRNTTKTKIIKTSVNFGKGMSFHLDKSGQPIKTEKASELTHIGTIK